VAAAVVDVWL